VRRAAARRPRHHDDNVIHPEGRVDPMADIETIETELVYADLESAPSGACRALHATPAAGGQGAAVAEERWLRELIEAPAAGQGSRGWSRRPPTTGGRRQPVPAHAKTSYSWRTSTRATTRSRRVAEHARRTAPAPSPSPRRIEAELSELDRRRGARHARGARRRRVGPRPCRPRRLRAARADRVLHRGRGEARAVWHLRRGLTAWHAAGQIHSDIQKGFVRAEVIAWDALVEAGGYAPARDRGTLRLEGRDYVMTDGDVITVKHTG
jgi:ribosome-binding ATPase YchF (GTP1/OBG family)